MPNWKVGNESVNPANRLAQHKAFTFVLGMGGNPAKGSGCAMQDYHGIIDLNYKRIWVSAMNSITNLIPTLKGFGPTGSEINNRRRIIQLW